MAGFKLRLHDINDSRLSEIRARGGVDVEEEGGGFAAVERATNDLGAAVDGADVVIIVTGGSAQAVVAQSLVPLLQNGHVILLVQGNTGGSLIVHRALDKAGCRSKVDVSEMDNFPYSCWRLLKDLDAFGAVLMSGLVLFAGLMTQASATIAKAMSPEMTASQALAGANAAAPAQLKDDSASANVTISDEFWRRRNWLRFAWTRNQN